MKISQWIGHTHHAPPLEATPRNALIRFNHASVAMQTSHHMFVRRYVVERNKVHPLYIDSTMRELVSGWRNWAPSGTAERTCGASVVGMNNNCWIDNSDHHYQVDLPRYNPHLAAEARHPGTGTCSMQAPVRHISKIHRMYACLSIRRHSRLHSSASIHPRTKPSIAY